MPIKKKQVTRYKSATEKMEHCAHSIFCASFGEYKCDFYCRRIQDAESECVRCRNHVRLPIGERKKRCHCEICMKHYEHDEVLYKDCSKYGGT